MSQSIKIVIFLPAADTVIKPIQQDLEGSPTHRRESRREKSLHRDLQERYAYFMLHLYHVDSQGYLALSFFA